MNKIKKSLEIEDQIIPKSYWQVYRSGRVLELRVIPQIDENPQQYRLGVIQIGRILYRVKSFLTLTSAKPRIQLFPNLAENQLAAIIYWPELLSSDIRSEPKKNKEKKISVSYIQSLSGKYNLVLKEHSESKDLLKKPGKSWFALFSISNQPFIWLKLGQFIEELKSNSFDDSQFSLDDIVLMNADKLPDKLGSIEKNYYLQVLLNVPY